MQATGKHPLVVGIGELLWDQLPTGRQLGGAPANFAHHAKQLGARSAVVSCVGDDPDGRQIIDRLQGLGVATGAISVHPTLPTGTVAVELAADGVPRYEIRENVAWDHIGSGAAEADAVAAADALVFGSLAQRSAGSRQAILGMLDAAAPRALRVFDINLRQHYYSRELIEDNLRIADVLKLNEHELAVLAPMLGLRGNEHAQLRALADACGLRWIALTRGDRGSLLCSTDTFADHPGCSAAVVDTVGAGDAFTACLVLGLLHGWGLERINQAANELAAFVCSRAGATPVLPDSMRTWFRPSGSAGE